jgi:hypothetical protein
MVLALFKDCPAVLTLEREAEETHKAAVIRLAIGRWQAAGQAANTKRIRRRKAVPVSIRARHTPLRASTKGKDEASAIAATSQHPLLFCFLFLIYVSIIIKSSDIKIKYNITFFVEGNRYLYLFRFH